MDRDDAIKEAEALVQSVMSCRDSSHDAFHAFRVRDLALSLASEEGLPSNKCFIVELASLLHDIDDYKYASRDEKHETAEELLLRCKLPVDVIDSVLHIIHNMGYTKEIADGAVCEPSTEFGVVQDADRLDAIGAIGIARCFTFGGSRNRLIYDPNLPPSLNLTWEEYTKKDRKYTAVNHFYEKLLKLKDMMKTKAGKQRAVSRHKFMEDFLAEFHEEWEGRQ